jgi:hypothetical protein
MFYLVVNGIIYVYISDILMLVVSLGWLFVCPSVTNFLVFTIESKYGLLIPSTRIF